MGIINNKEIIDTSRKYNLRPGSMKCKAFALFDKGNSGAEVKLLLRSQGNKNYKIFTNTIDKYRYDWKRL